MELRQLRYFVTVAEELHFSRAAKKLHMSQPPLSRHIQRLEEELDLELLHRTHRSVRLTSAGAVFLRQALKILENIDRARRLCARTRLGETGALSLGIDPFSCAPEMPDLIGRYCRRSPGVTLTVAEMESGDQLEALRRGGIEVGILQSRRRDLSDFESAPLASVPSWLAVPEADGLAAHDVVPIQALDGADLILPPEHARAGAPRAAIEACRQAGFEPRVRIEVLGYRTALGLVAGKLGVALVPRTCAAREREGVVYRPLESPLPDTQIRMVWQPDELSGAARGFVEMALGTTH